MKATWKFHLLLVASLLGSSSTIYAANPPADEEEPVIFDHKAGAKPGIQFTAGETASPSAAGAIPEIQNITDARKLLADLNKSFAIDKAALKDTLVTPFIGAARDPNINIDTFLADKERSALFNGLDFINKPKAIAVAKDALGKLKESPADPGVLFNDTFTELTAPSQSTGPQGGGQGNGSTDPATAQQKKELDEAKEALAEIKAGQQADRDQRFAEQQQQQRAAEEARRQQQAAGGGGSGGAGGGGGGSGGRPGGPSQGLGGPGGFGGSGSGDSSSKTPQDSSNHSKGLEGLTKALKNASSGNGLRDAANLSRSLKDFNGDPKDKKKEPDFSSLKSKETPKEEAKKPAKPELPDILNGNPLPTVPTSASNGSNVDLGQGTPLQVTPGNVGADPSLDPQAALASNSGGIGSVPMTKGSNSTGAATPGVDGSFPFNVDGAAGPDDNPPPASVTGLRKIPLELADFNATSATEGNQDYSAGMTDAMLAAKANLQRALSEQKAGMPSYLYKPSPEELADRQAPGVLGFLKSNGQSRTQKVCRTDSGNRVGVCFRFQKSLTQTAGLQPG